MKCDYLYVDDLGIAHCDCRSPQAGGQISDRGVCNPNICKIPKNERESS